MVDKTTPRQKTDSEAVTTYSDGLTQWPYTWRDHMLFNDSLDHDQVQELDLSSAEKKHLMDLVDFSCIANEYSGCCNLNIIKDTLYLKVLIDGKVYVRQFDSVKDLGLYLVGYIESPGCWTY